MRFCIFMPVRTSIWIQPTVEARTLKNLRPKREDTVGPLGSPCFTILQGLIWDQTKAGSAILAGSGVSLSKSGTNIYGTLFCRYPVPVLYITWCYLQHYLGSWLCILPICQILLFCRVWHPFAPSRPSIFMFVLVYLSSCRHTLYLRYIFTVRTGIYFVCWHKVQLSNCFSSTSITCHVPLIKIVGGTTYILAFLLDCSYYKLCTVVVTNYVTR